MNSGCSVWGIFSKHPSTTAPPLASVYPPFPTHSFHDQRPFSQRDTLIIPSSVHESRTSSADSVLLDTTDPARKKPEGYHQPRSSSSPQLSLPCFEGIGVLNADVRPSSPLIDAARIPHVESYFPTRGTDSVREFCKKASEKGKIFVLNLSAPFTQVFESEAWASANGLPNLKGLPAVTKALAQQQKSNLTRDRVVVFTRGATIAVCSSSPVNVKTCAVDALKDEGVVDTDGAGDAFAGNLPGILAAGKSLDRVIEVGHTLGTMCIAQAGPQYKWPKVVVLCDLCSLPVQQVLLPPFGQKWPGRVVVRTFLGDQPVLVIDYGLVVTSPHPGAEYRKVVVVPIGVLTGVVSLPAVLAIAESDLSGGAGHNVSTTSPRYAREVYWFLRGTRRRSPH